MSEDYNPEELLKNQVWLTTCCILRMIVMTEYTLYTDIPLLGV